MFHSTYWAPCLSVDLELDLAASHSQLKRFALSHWALAACKLTILMVSGFDIYLTIKYVDYLPMLELNPVGRWLMGLDGSNQCDVQQVAAFVTAKFAGNYAALLVIETLAAWKKRVAHAVAFGVAICQLILLYFLAFYEPASPIVH